MAATWLRLLTTLSSSPRAYHVRAVGARPCVRTRRAHCPSLYSLTQRTRARTCMLVRRCGPSGTYLAWRELWMGEGLPSPDFLQMAADMMGKGDDGDTKRRDPSVSRATVKKREREAQRKSGKAPAPQRVCTYTSLPTDSRLYAHGMHHTSACPSAGMHIHLAPDCVYRMHMRMCTACACHAHGRVPLCGSERMHLAQARLEPDAGKLADEVAPLAAAAAAIDKDKYMGDPKTFSYTCATDPALFGRLRIRCWCEGERRPSMYAAEVKLPRFTGGLMKERDAKRRLVEELRASCVTITTLESPP